MMPTELARISSLQLENLSKEKTVFFFPVGPIEDHGSHLPVGLDLDEAVRISHLAATRVESDMPGWTGVVMPMAPFGVQSNTTRLAITVRPYILRDWLVDACVSLMRIGFVNFVCFSGHSGPSQLTAIEEAGRIVWRKGRWSFWAKALKGMSPRSGATLVSAHSALVDFKKVQASPFWPDPAEHGGQRDTSVALAVSGDWVNTEFSSFPKVERIRSRWMRNFRRRRLLMDGYWGDPSRATKEIGERELEQVVHEVFPKLKAVWDGANPNFLFRSWYSILPPNKSFFKGWVLAVFIVIFILGWAFMMAATLELK